MRCPCLGVEKRDRSKRFQKTSESARTMPGKSWEILGQSPVKHCLCVFLTLFIAFFFWPFSGFREGAFWVGQQVHIRKVDVLSLPLNLDGPAIRNANRGNSRESILRKKKKKPYCHTFERFARIASNLRFAIFQCPETRFAKKGFSSGTLKL